jgi:hypothetical protein
MLLRSQLDGHAAFFVVDLHPAVLECERVVCDGRREGSMELRMGQAELSGEAVYRGILPW